MAEITTLGDWNARLTACGGCGMPECPEPSFEYQSKTATASPCGYRMVDTGYQGETPCAAIYIWYRSYTTTATWHYEASGPIGGGHATETEDSEVITTRTKSWVVPEEEGERTCSEHLTIEGSSTYNQTVVIDPVVPPAFPTRDGYTDTIDETRSKSYDSEVDPAPPCVSSTTSASTAGGGSSTTTPGTACPVDVTLEGLWISSTGTSFTIGISFSDSVVSWSKQTVVAFSDPIDLATMMTDITTAFEGLEYAAGDALASRTIVYAECDGEPVLEAPQSVSETRGQYRPRIPSSHKGSMFELEWDEVFFPDGWDEPGYDGDAPTMTPKGPYVWTGPGDQGDPTGDSWTSVWSEEVVIPEGASGTVELRNLRGRCYSGTRYGSKIQHWGPTYIPEEE